MRAIFLFFLLPGIVNAQATFRDENTTILPYGNKVESWEKPIKVKRTIYVNNTFASANDENPGTLEKPLKTINKAAQIAEPGDKIIIKEGVYRESIHPMRGGNSPESLIEYCAAENEKVVIKGSIELDLGKFVPTKGWNIYEDRKKYIDSAVSYQYSFDGSEFNGYNPFGMMNILHDREWLQYKQNIYMWPHFKRRGLLFLNGQLLKQVEKVTELSTSDSGAYWVEHNGLTIHVRFPGMSKPTDHTLIEAVVKEQLFAPKEYYTSYIKINGLHFMHSANGFPVPQRGMISANRGHHFIIENCTIEWANSVGIDLGNEMWNTKRPKPYVGYDIVRNNIIRYCGVSGLQGMGAVNMIIEDNLFDSIGWQNAEMAFESGGIKLHWSKNTLIRRNVFRDIQYAPGIWLDYNCSENNRVTQNVFTNILTARGAVYVEVSHNQCRIDHNIFHKVNSRYWLSGDYGAGGSAFYTDGSDSIQFDHNLILDIENTGYGAYLNADRMVNDRGGITRWHKVTNNIFVDCKKHDIEFANDINFAENNIHCNSKSGYIKIGNPLPALKLNLDATRKIYQWNKYSFELKNVTYSLDKENLLLNVTFPSELQNNTFPAGPFKNLSSFKNFSLDVRKKQQ